jgi:hypothetical protein
VRVEATITRRRHRPCASTLVFALLLAVSLLDGCRTTHGVALPDIAALRCESTLAATPQRPDIGALRRLATKEQAPLVGAIDHSAHGNAGPLPPIDVHGATESDLALALRAAARIACQLRTPDDAERAGYALSSYFTEGIGSHWTNWRFVDAPFDPARPSMLLFGPRLGTIQLVGFSYWVRSPDPAGPDGFSGPADKWHRHFGMCFDRTGLLLREELRAPALCKGIYLNGSDIWMLHAWIVPGAANVWGVFAPLNPQLCSRAVADIVRCPGMEGP